MNRQFPKGNENTRPEKNRQPAFAGQFYPAAKEELTYQLDEFFQHAKNIAAKNGKPRAIISPHAGYMYSGQVAASAFNQIPDNTNYKRVFVLASSHHFHFEGAAIFSSGNYMTPLGQIKVDTALAQQLEENSDIFLDKPEAHEFEHSLEVQLPFLQQKLTGDFLLVPIILGTNRPEDSKKIASALKKYFTPENLFIISTDFSHYPGFEDAKQVDLLTANAICSNNPEILLKTIEENKKRNITNLATSLCGWTSVLTLLYMTQNEKVVYQKIEYRNSGYTPNFGDRRRVVGYWAIAVSESENEFQISEAERKELLQNAKKSVTYFLETGKRKIFPGKLPTNTNLHAGAFVSIYANGVLRGCIGNFSAEKTLNESIQSSAVSAANDVRFEQLQVEDLENMELEISILSPMRKINSIDEIVLGKHGIYIKKGVHNGTFLPQVATKTGWDVMEFLGRCARDKAGIGWDGWKDADIYVYEAYIFRGK